MAIKFVFSASLSSFSSSFISSKQGEEPSIKLKTFKKNCIIVIYGGAGVHGASLGHLMHKERRHSAQRLRATFVFGFYGKKRCFCFATGGGFVSSHSLARS